jgi:transposase
MAMGTRRKRRRQESLWVPVAELPSTAAHPFYQRLNQILDDAHFDDFVETACQRFYAPTMGRPSLAPGIYFRLLLLGYFEGLDSERGIAWRAADSLAIRRFLRVGLDEPVADHSTISRTRRLIDVETHRAVFTWIQERLVDRGLLTTGPLGIDGTTLEANAALRSIVRRDTGETYQAFLTQLAQASGIATPTREDLAKIDKKRKKKGSNDDWQHPDDPDASITKMKDGRTHLAHKAEHAVDLKCGAIVAVTLQRADAGDTQTIQDTLVAAVEQLEATVGLPADAPLEVVTDKGYHSNDVVTDLTALGVRTYISEPARGRRRWRGRAAAQRAVYANRRRIKGPRGQALRRQRGERLERTFAHAYETGGMRRTHLRGHRNILKRLLVHAGGFNLGLVMRTLVGVGTPRGLQGRLAAVVALLVARIRALGAAPRPHGESIAESHVIHHRHDVVSWPITWCSEMGTSTTGC